MPTTTQPPEIVSVLIEPSIYRKSGPSTYTLDHTSGTLDFRYGWKVIGDNGELGSGCYIKGIIPTGDVVVDIGNVPCGSGGWIGADLRPGTYTVTVKATTDWGAEKEGYWDFTAEA